MRDLSDEAVKLPHGCHESLCSEVHTLDDGREVEVSTVYRIHESTCPSCHGARYVRDFIPGVETRCPCCRGQGVFRKRYEVGRVWREAKG